MSIQMGTKQFLRSPFTRSFHTPSSLNFRGVRKVSRLNFYSFSKNKFSAVALRSPRAISILRGGKSLEINHNHSKSIFLPLISIDRKAYYSGKAIGNSVQSNDSVETWEVVDSWEHNQEKNVINTLPGSSNISIDEWLKIPRSENWYTGFSPNDINAPGRVEMQVKDSDSILTPTSKPKGLTEDQNLKKFSYISSLPIFNYQAKNSRENLLHYFQNAWLLTEILFAGLRGAAPFYVPPYHNLRHPLIFYYGHCACLYVNKLRVAGLLEEGVNEYFESIFEVGVDEMSWDDMDKNEMDWPTVFEVKEYRQQVYDKVVDIIRHSPDFDTLSTLGNKSKFWSILMGIEHEKIHLETSSVLIRELPIGYVQKPEAFPPYPPTINEYHSTSGQANKVSFPENEFVTIKGSRKVKLGKSSAHPTYGWDNEYGSKFYQISSDFQVQKFNVSNGEFYEFVTSNGYLNPEYWDKDGWQWRSFRNIKHPTFWIPVGPSGLQQYEYRTIFDEVAMPWSHPVTVNLYEAKAFCKWKSKQKRNQNQGDDKNENVEYRLLIEAEYYLIAGNSLTESNNQGMEENDPIHQINSFGKYHNLNYTYGSSSAVNFFPPNDLGIYDSRGNTWELMQDSMSPLNNFEVHPYYADFSVPCFDDKHFIIKGGSFISTGDEADIYSRYHFRPHFFQHAGFRLVESKELPQDISKEEEDKGDGVYIESLNLSESENMQKDNEKEIQEKYEGLTWLQRYLHLHYPDLENSDCIPSYLPKEAINFPKRCSDMLLQLCEREGIFVDDSKPTKALDLGCAVGRSTFELTRNFDRVDGVELSPVFVDTANQMKEKGNLKYQIPSEIDSMVEFSASLDSSLYLRRNQVDFFVGDATNLPPNMSQYDAVLMANVVCRLQDPKVCLSRMSGRTISSYDTANVNPNPTGTSDVSGVGGTSGVNRDIDEKLAIVKKGGILMLTTPFSWKENFTPKEVWFSSSSRDYDSFDGMQKFLEEEAGFKLIHKEDLPLIIRHRKRFYEYIVSLVSVWKRVN